MNAVEPAPRRGFLHILAAAVVLNIPFLLCHPARPVIDAPFPRSLAVNAVLFLLPAAPFVGLMIRRGRLRGQWLLWLFLLSSAVFVGSLVSVRILGLPARAGTIWNIEWLVCNLGVVLNLAFHKSSDSGVRVSGREILHALAPFLLAYLLLFHGATGVVPVLPDQDDEIQGTAYGLITHLQPSYRTARQTEYFLSHPPAVHVYVAGSLLYFGLLDRLAIYDSLRPGSLTAEAMYLHYRRHPHLLETRAPDIFFGALTAMLLCGWVTRLSGRWWAGLLVAFGYACTPAVFVRSSYAGYFAATNLLQILILSLLEDREFPSDRYRRTACFLAGALVALCDHKMVLLPVSVALWEFLRKREGGTRPAVLSAVSHPLVTGFAAGTAVFWAYGLAINPEEFFRDHVHNHLVDRILHHNPLGYGGYPGLAGLWAEFWVHSGYLLLPLGIVSLGALCFGGRMMNIRGSGWRGTAGLWCIWTLVIALVFSVVDWRQSKHLAPMAMPLMLASAHYVLKRFPIAVAGILFAALLACNMALLLSLAGDFGSIPAVPDW
ncbi:MAG: hypothetical protein H6Q84_1104 [Deltaproteobacteria bacterium]|nr:hypothetical protein [Deltaproteobacteria bacterium]